MIHPNIMKALIAALTLSVSYALPNPTGNSPKDNTELIGKLVTTPIQSERFRKLLTDASGTKLLTDEALVNATVWDFNQNGANITGSQGGTNSGVRSLYLTFTSFSSNA